MATDLMTGTEAGTEVAMRSQQEQGVTTGAGGMRGSSMNGDGMEAQLAGSVTGGVTGMTGGGVGKMKVAGGWVVVVMRMAGIEEQAGGVGMMRGETGTAAAATGTEMTGVAERIGVGVILRNSAMGGAAGGRGTGSAGATTLMRRRRTGTGAGGDSCSCSLVADRVHSKSFARLSFQCLCS
jgi:hypothetical protein